MSKRYLSLILSCFWPGLGHLYLKKYLSGIIYFLVWVLLLSTFLQTFPQPILMASRRTYFIIRAGCLFFWVAVIGENFQILRKQKEIQGSFSPLIPCFFAIFAFIFFSLPLKWHSPGSVVGNLHTHTTCSDGRGDYEAIIDLALRLKFDFIAFTDHRFQGIGGCVGGPPGSCNDAVCEEIVRKCLNEERLLCVLGQEVSGRVHILALGIKEGINENQPIREIVRQIHEQGGVAIAAHPYQAVGDFTEEELVNSGFDAMECERGTRKQNNDQYALAQQYNLPCVYNSDTHEIGMLRSVYNVCNQEIKILDDLKEAIKGNRCHRFIPDDAWLSVMTSPYYWR